MKRIFKFSVADFLFGLLLPEDYDIKKELAPLLPFYIEESTNTDFLFIIDCEDREKAPRESEQKLLEESENDMGHICLMSDDNHFSVSFCQTPGGKEHLLCCDKMYTHIRAYLHWEDPYASRVLLSMVRVIFSQVILAENAVAVHASAVQLDGYAFLFMGRSGTGKSTHADLWRAHFPDCELINDDNPILKIEKEQVWIYGSPWSGKRHCYRNVKYPVKGIVRLRQSPHNLFCEKNGVDAFLQLLPGVSVIKQDKERYNALCGTLVRISTLVSVGMMECLPNQEAAQICMDNLNK